MAFQENICAVPCPRFIKASEDPLTGMIRCLNCNMMMVDDDPLMDSSSEDEE